MLTIGQGIAVSYNAILNEKRSPANQWAEASLLHKFEKMGFIKHEDFGPLLEWTLDYQANPSFGFLPTDLAPVSLSVTEVLTAGQSAPAQISGSIVWTKMQEATNPTRNQKVALIKSLTTNAIETHDDQLERAFFAANTNGFLGMPTHILSTGLGTDEGIDSSANTFWRNQNGTYVDDTDIEAGMTTLHNSCAKGSGAQLVPTLIVSDGPTQSIFESTQQPLQRWTNGAEANAGFKTLKFKNADYIFSQYGTSSLYFLNPRCIQVVVSKSYFRDLGDTQELQNGQGFRKLVYSACQMGTNNRSRLGVLHV